MFGGHFGRSNDHYEWMGFAGVIELHGLGGGPQGLTEPGAAFLVFQSASQMTNSTFLKVLFLFSDFLFLFWFMSLVKSASLSALIYYELSTVASWSRSHWFMSTKCMHLFPSLHSWHCVGRLKGAIMGIFTPQS